MSEPEVATARISDLTYRNYDGPLKDRRFRWWPVALAVLRTNARKPGYWILVGIVVLIFLLHGLVAFLTRNFSGMVPPQAREFITFKGHGNLYSDSLASALWWLNLFPTFLIALVVGSGSVAADNRANALLVYLSKPVTKGDYLLGKWMGLFILIGSVSLLPSLLLYLFYLTTYFSEGFFSDNPTLVLRIFPATLIPAAIHSSLILGISSYSRSPAMAGAAYAGLLTVTGAAVTATIGSVLFNRVLLDEDLDKASKAQNRRAVTITCLSVGGVSNGIGCLLYDVDPNYVKVIPPPQIRRRAESPSPIPLALLAGALVLVPVGAAAAKVRAVEIVGG